MKEYATLAGELAQKYAFFLGIAKKDAEAYFFL